MSAPSSVLLLHGWQNRREADHWQSRVAGILRGRGVEVHHPQLPDPDEPDPGAWAAEARAALAEMTPGHRVVACHSLGCLLWARMAGEEAAERVAWVAPPGPDELRAYTEITAFLPERIDGETLRASSTAAPLRLVYSDDDPYCAVGADAAYGEPLGLDTELLPGQAHINPDSGYGDWPAMVDWCLDGATRFRRTQHRLRPTMTLRDLMGDGAPKVEITGLAYSSKSVSEGTLFFCVPGFKVDGHDFAPDAVERGAAALVCQRPLGLGVPEVVVDDVRVAMGPVASTFFGDPTAKMQVAGITGTNGKTTTAFLMRDVLETAGLHTGLLGTVKQVVGGLEEQAVRTTGEAIDLQETFVRMRNLGDQACAMEVSSHALELGRADGITFAVKIFTNLTQDHLDFHPDMEAYYKAKRRLFDQPGPAVVNVDDQYGVRLAGELEDATTFALEGGPEAHYTARDIRFDVAGAVFTVDTPDGPVGVTTRLPGLFNVSNALAAFTAARVMGIEAEVAAKALADAGRVPGRFEPVEEGQGFGVLVDYAHTPDSLENVLRAARKLTEGTLHVVFGAGGDRDKAKRPLMGQAAAAHADRLVVTSDNPRSEDPGAIVDQVMEGAGPDAQRQVDRRKAIGAAIGAAQDGDVVVIAGKGHEQGQEFEDGRKEPFDDVQVARQALRERS